MKSTEYTQHLRHIFLVLILIQAMPLEECVHHGLLSQHEAITRDTYNMLTCRVYR